MSDNLQFLRRVSIVWEDEMEGKKATRKQLWQMLVDNNLAPDPGDLLEDAKDHYVGGIMHQLRVHSFRTRDDQGVFQLVSLKLADDDGNIRPFAKPLNTLTVEEDAQHLIARHEACKVAGRHFDYYAKDAIKRHGREPLQALLPFALPEYPQPARKKKARPTGV